MLGLNDVAFLGSLQSQPSDLWTPAATTTALWADAADASTITESGGLMSQWSDKSGSNRHLLQPTVSDQPTYSTSAWNGSPAVLFNQSFLSPATNITANGQSWYFVTQRTGGAGTSAVMGAANANFIPIAQAGATSTVLFRCNNIDNPAELSAFINGEVIKAKNSAPVINRDTMYSALGNKLILETCGIRTFSAAPQLGKALADYSGYFLVGMVAEVVVSNSDSSTTERQLIEGYLAHKWGLAASLPANHPYKTEAPTLASAPLFDFLNPANIGQPVGGGYFGGLISHTADGNPTHALIVAPAATGATGTGYTLTTNLAWKTSDTATTGTTSLFDGAANTAAMVAAGIANHPAAQFCTNLTIGGFNDWYLPSQFEKDIVYFNLKPTTTSNATGTGINAYAVPPRTANYTAGSPAQTAVAAFQTGGAEAFAAAAHWASNEVTAANGRRITYNNGAISAAAKSTLNPVRAFRRVVL
jgi:hypothetical protein